MKANARVTIGLLDGQTRSGRLPHFSPYLPELLVLREAGHGTALDRIPGEQVAYVLFHRNGEDPLPPRPTEAGCRKLKIHVAGGRSFLVETALPASANPLGFFATTVDADNPPQEIYFFAKGVNAREDSEPLGSMLVHEGLLAPSALQKGLEQQDANRKSLLGSILVEQHKVKAEAVEHAVQQQKRRGVRLGQVLVEAGFCTTADVENALAEQRTRKGKRLGEILVEMGVIKETDLAMTLASKFHLPFVNLDDHQLNPAAIREVPRDILERFGVLPLDTDEKNFLVALADPMAFQAADILRQHLDKRIHEVVCTPSKLKAYLAKALEEFPVGTDGTPEAGHARKVDDTDDQDHARQSQFNSGTQDPSVDGLTEQLIMDAYARGASDIHIEHNGRERQALIRLRVDGDLMVYQDIQPALATTLVSRIKNLAGLSFAERRKPQEGKLTFPLEDRVLELRVLTLPTLSNQEDVVIHIQTAPRFRTVDELGLSDPTLQGLKHLLQRRGLFLCVGPRGCGKTTTLHALLATFNPVVSKVCAAEDPVELHPSGVRQLHVQGRSGFTMAAAVKAMMCADPDVMLVGDLRDHETALLAMEAALDNHLVLSSLPTLGTVETVLRLLDMGLGRFAVHDALLGVMALRVVRALCLDCRESYVPSQVELDGLREVLTTPDMQRLLSNPEQVRLFRGRGCATCHGSGYRGRVGLQELLIVNQGVRHAILGKPSYEEMDAAVHASGIPSVLQDGMMKCLDGRTDLGQVRAVCQR